MRLETKIGAAITVVALGVVAGVVAWQGGILPKQPTAPLAQNEPPAPIVAPVPEAAPTTGGNTGALASPPPIGLRDDAERSFRPKDPAPVEPQPAATERTGLSEVAATPPTPAITPTPVVVTPPPVESKINTPPAPPAITQAPVATPAATPPTEPTKEHIIEVGDNFSTLAAKYLGNAKYATLIAKANPDADPKRLKLGAKIKIPPVPAAPPAPVATATPTAPTAQPPVAAAKKVSEPLPPIPEGRAYKVQPGESWNDLGKKFFGDAQRWPELYEMNKERVPHNPRNLRPGVTIEVPASKPA